jgi:hypothetical protein
MALVSGFRVHRRPRVGFVALLILAIVPDMTGSVASAQTAKTGGVTGAVVARETGQAVDGAAVAIEKTSLTAVTNPIGRFGIDGVPVGRASLIVTAPGFLDLRVADVQVAPGAPGSLPISSSACK